MEITCNLFFRILLFTLFSLILDPPSVPNSIEEANVSSRSMSPVDGRAKASNGPSSPKLTAVQCPPPPPPPLPAEKIPPSKPAKPQKQPKDAQNMLQEELKERMTLGPKSHKKLASIQQLKHMHCIYITPESTSLEVQSWLEVKGFSSRTLKVLKEMNGENMFELTKEQMEKYLGHEEGARLNSHLTVQKNICGFKTYKHQELKSILDKRRQKVDGTSEQTTKEVSNNSSTKVTDSKEEEADPEVASKTLRYLLRDQRKKIASHLEQNEK